LTFAEILLACMLMVVLAMAAVLIAHVGKSNGTGSKRKNSKSPERLSGTLGGMEIQSFLSEGGMAEVYVAVSPAFGRVALKVLKQQHAGDAESVRSFFNEGRILQELQGGPVPHCYDFAFDPVTKRAYIALGFVEGQKLSDLLEIGRTFSRNETTAIMRDLAAALVVIHDAGYCHMDVSAPNVITKSAGSQVIGATLIDFGAVETTVLEKRVSKSLFGKWAYMPPEQYWADLASPAGDIYSLGILYYRLLFGTLPFHSKTEDPSEIMALHRDAPASFPAAADPETVKALSRMLAKNHEVRPTAHEVRDLFARQAMRPTQPNSAKQTAVPQTQVTVIGNTPTSYQQAVPAPKPQSAPSPTPKPTPTPTPTKQSRAPRAPYTVARNLLMCMIAIIVVGVGVSASMLTLRSKSVSKTQAASLTIDDKGPSANMNRSTEIKEHKPSMPNTTSKEELPPGPKPVGDFVVRTTTTGKKVWAAPDAIRGPMLNQGRLIPLKKDRQIPLKK